MVKKLKIPKKLIPVTGPSITKKEVRYIAEAARDGWHENHSKYVNLFEKKFAEYVGRKYAVATSSCTAALHLSFLALGIKKGDEVIAPNITWIASVAPLYHLGAKPIFADIDPKTWCLDPESVEKNITKKTKAILIVDLYGHVADMGPILKIAKKHNLKVIEDAAEAVGGEYHGKKAGGFGDASCFSFHGSKTLTTGEGGMLLTDNAKVAKRARHFYEHCKDPKKIFWNLDVGHKYKMSNLQAACGLAQLERIDEMVERKRDIFSWYQNRLKDIPGLQLNYEMPGTKNTYWMVTAVFDKKYGWKKEALLKKLTEFNIQARPFFYPLSLMPPTRSNAYTPVSFDISSRAVNLPCGQNITKKTVDYVCDAILSILEA